MSDRTADSSGNGRQTSRRRVLRGLGVGAVGLAGIGSATATGSNSGVEAPAQMDAPNIGSDPAILVFSATAGYTHEVIPTANQTIQELATEIGNENNVEFTVDVITGAVEAGQSDFPTSADVLSQYDVVVWNSTTGNVLNEEQQAAFEEYIRNGGGYMGIHAAADTEYEWEFYGDLVGAYFMDHPEPQEAEVQVTDRTHPSTDQLPASWTRFDEWYNYQSNPRDTVNVLATLDESTYSETGYKDYEMPGSDHPIAWYQTYEGARSWYTGMGHTEESYSDENFRQHLKGGLMWSAGYVDDNETRTVVPYQVDFVAGEPNEELGESEDDFYGRQGRLIQYVHGNSDGITRRDTWINSLDSQTRECVSADPIEIIGDAAVVHFTVAEGCELTLSLASYTLPGGEFSFETAGEQQMAAGETDTFGPGEHTLEVELPGELVEE